MRRYQREGMRNRVTSINERWVGKEENRSEKRQTHSGLFAVVLYFIRTKVTKMQNR